jgi:hypothetical protein
MLGKEIRRLRNGIFRGSRKLCSRKASIATSSNSPISRQNKLSQKLLNNDRITFEYKISLLYFLAKQEGEGIYKILSDKLVSFFMLIGKLKSISALNQIHEEVTVSMLIRQPKF